MITFRLFFKHFFHSLFTPFFIQFHCWTIKDILYITHVDFSNWPVAFVSILFTVKSLVTSTSTLLIFWLPWFHVFKTSTDPILHSLPDIRRHGYTKELVWATPSLILHSGKFFFDLLCIFIGSSVSSRWLVGNRYWQEFAAEKYRMKYSCYETSLDISRIKCVKLGENIWIFILSNAGFALEHFQY